MTEGVKLTRREKEAVRDMACGRCGATPPFTDSKKCHAHRILPGYEGGEYVHGNVVSRCVPCHDIEHGGNGQRPFVGAAKLGNSRRSLAGKQKCLAGMKTALLAQGRSLTGLGAINAAKTHCEHGHPFNEENTYWYTTPRGGKGRGCRTCVRAKKNRDYWKRRDHFLALSKTDAVRESKRRYKQRNRSKLQAAQNEWRARTREVRRERDRERYWSDPEKQRQRQRDWLDRRKAKAAAS